MFLDYDTKLENLNMHSDKMQILNRELFNQVLQYHNTQLINKIWNVIWRNLELQIVV